MKNKKLLFAIIGAVLVVAGVLCVFLLWPKKSKKEIYLEAMKKSLGFDLSQVEEKVDYEKLKDMIQHTTAEGTITAEGQAINVKADLYSTLEKIYLNLVLSDNEKNADIDMLFKDNKMYFTVKDMLEKYYIYEDYGSALPSESIPSLNYEKLGKIFKDNFTEAIESKRIEVSDSDKIIKDVEYSTKKYLYTFTGTDAYNMLVNVIKDVKDDKELYDQLKSMITINGAMDFDALLEQGEKELEVLKDINDLLSYTVYLKGDEVISTEIVAYIPTSMAGKKASVPVTIVINNIDKYYQAYLSAVGFRMFEFVADGVAGKLSLQYMGEEVINGTISDNKVTIKNASHLIPDFELSMDIDKTNNVVKLVLDALGIKGEFTIKGYENTKEFPNIDVSGAVPYTEATVKDKEILDQMFAQKDQFVEYQSLEVPSL